MLHAAFICQIQPLDPCLTSFVTHAEPALNGKARGVHVKMLQELKGLCGHHRMTIGSFATNGDGGCDHLHEAQSKLNMQMFMESQDVPSTQYDRPMSDFLYLLKRARYRMVKKIRMVVGLKITTFELPLQTLIELIGNDLPAVVFGDDPVTKMYDSLPMVPFRVAVLQKLSQAW
jgi:hypothetical protein